jgi:hypothetical protein
LYKRGFAQAGSDAAAEILYEMFACCAVDCKQALEKMAADTSVWCYGNNMDVFNRFVKELGKGLRKVEKVEIF